MLFAYATAIKGAYRRRKVGLSGAGRGGVFVRGKTSVFEVKILLTKAGERVGLSFYKKGEKSLK